MLTSDERWYGNNVLGVELRMPTRLHVTLPADSYKHKCLSFVPDIWGRWRVNRNVKTGAFSIFALKGWRLWLLGGGGLSSVPNTRAARPLA